MCEVTRKVHLSRTEGSQGGIQGYKVLILGTTALGSGAWLPRDVDPGLVLPNEVNHGGHP